MELTEGTNYNGKKRVNILLTFIYLINCYVGEKIKYEEVCTLTIIVILFSTIREFNKP